jgi:SagB-type dehydrogenase family enzyme
VPIDSSVAGPILRDGAGVVRSVTHLGEPGERKVHFRAYSSAGALYPIEAYVADSHGLLAFDPLERDFVRVAGGDARARIADAAAAPELRRAGAIVVLTGIHARTGWKYLERGYRHVWWDAGTMLANLLALAGSEGLGPRLYTAFVDRELNQVLGVDGVHEYALALLAVGGAAEGVPENGSAPTARVPQESGREFPNAARLHEASSLADAAAVHEWRSPVVAEEPPLPREQLERAIRRRSSVRSYSDEPLPRDELADLLAWSEAPIPADAAPVVRQAVTVAAVEGLEPGIYDTALRLVASCDAEELRRDVGFAAMEQDHPRIAAANVFQLANVDAVVERHGDRGYRWAQLEAGIRAGRLQVGAFARGWGAAASTFYDDEVSRVLETPEAPMLMVALGRR